jgi:hypothetical protein
MAALAGFDTLHGAPASAFVPKFRVTAPLILVRSADGQLHHTYRGCMLGWLSPEQEKQFLEDRLVERVTAK